MPRVWRILSIDGGGIRGIIPAMVLVEIERRTRKRIHELFDLIAGTSTGGILAIGLTTPESTGKPAYTAQDMKVFYELEGPKIFHNPASWLKNVLHAKYTSEGIKKVIEGRFGRLRLSDTLTDVLIPCYDIEHRTPLLFKSRWAKRDSRYDFLIADVALATSAAPTFFDPATVARPGTTSTLSLVDGGVFANNPAMHGFVEVSTVLASEEDDFLVASLGTGEATKPLTAQEVKSWGYAQWSRPIIELVSDSVSESVHAQMRYLLPVTQYQRYYRFQVDLPEQADEAIDNVTEHNLIGLMQAGRDLLTDHQSSTDLDRLCARLLQLQSQDEEAQDSASRQPASFNQISKGSGGDSGLPEPQQSAFAIPLCYAQEDMDAAASLARCLAKKDIQVSFDRYALQPQASMRRLISQAGDHSPVAIVFLSPAFFKNSWIALQLSWLYARTLGGKTIILPVMHGFEKEDVPQIARTMQWTKLTAGHLSNLSELAVGTTANIESLCDRLADEIRRWLK